MRTREELAWAAGIVEGEGCITYTTRSGPLRNRTQARIQVAMCDEDVVERVHDVYGMGIVDYLYPPSARMRGNKPQWRWRVWSFEHIQATIAMLWPWLGQRRRARAIEVLTALKNGTISNQERARRGILATRAYRVVHPPARDTRSGRFGVG